MVSHNYAPGDLLQLVRAEAVAFRQRSPGYDLDDLMSVAGEAVAEALARLAPDMDPEKRWSLVKVTIRSRLKDHARAERVVGRRCSRLPADGDGNELPVRDRRADDPYEAVAAREQLAGGHLLPRPDEAAAKAVALREAMFGAVRVEHVRAMMERLGERAAGGDLAASKVLIGLLDRPAGGPVQQTAVIINRGDA